MRLCFLLPEVSAPGGRVRTTFHLAGALAERHEVEIASVGKTLRDPRYPPPAGVVLTPLADRATLAHHIRRSHGRVLIGTSPALNILLARVAPADAITIGHEHFNLRVHNRATHRRQEMRTWYRHLDAHVSLTRRDAGAYRQFIDAGPLVLAIPNAIGDPGDIRADPTAKVALAAGRLEPVKGFDLLLQAWSDVVDSEPGWQLRIFGDGSRRAELEAQCEALGLTDSVAMPGFTDRLADEMAKASFFVLSSRSEGLPMAMLEAMSVGLPSVSFDCYTGPRDVITFGVDGFLVAGQRVDGLAATMKAMIDTRSNRAQLGAAAIRTSRRFRLDVVVQRWERLFARLAARARRNESTTPR